MAGVPAVVAGFAAATEGWRDTVFAPPVAVAFDEAAGLAEGTAERRKAGAESAVVTLDGDAEAVVVASEDAIGLAEGTFDTPEFACDAGKLAA